MAIVNIRETFIILAKDCVDHEALFENPISDSKKTQVGGWVGRVKASGMSASLINACSFFVLVFLR